MEKVVAILVFALICSVSAYPYNVNVTDIRATSAVLHWKTTELDVEEFLIQCIGTQYYAVARDGRVHNTEMHVRSQFIPQGIDSVRIGDLRPNYNYSCVIQETLPEDAQDYNGILSKPVNFTSDYAEPVRPKAPVIVKEDGITRVNLYKSSSNKFGPITGYKVQFHVIEDSFLGDIAVIDREFTNPSGKFSPVSVEYAQASPKALSFQISYPGPNLPSFIQIDTDLMHGALKNGVLYRVITVAYTKCKDSSIVFAPSTPSDSFIAVGVDKFISQGRFLNDVRSLQIRIGIIAGILLPLVCLVYMCCIGILLLCREKHLAKKYKHDHNTSCLGRALECIKNKIMISWLTCLTLCVYLNPCRKCCRCKKRHHHSKPYHYQKFHPMGENMYTTSPHDHMGHPPGPPDYMPDYYNVEDYPQTPYYTEKRSTRPSQSTPQRTTTRPSHSPQQSHRTGTHTKHVPTYEESSSSDGIRNQAPSFSSKQHHSRQSSYPQYTQSIHEGTHLKHVLSSLKPSPTRQGRVSPSVSFARSVDKYSPPDAYFSRDASRVRGVSPNPSFHTANEHSRGHTEVFRNTSVPRARSPSRGQPSAPGASRSASYVSLPSSGHPYVPYKVRSGIPPNASSVSMPSRTRSPPRRHHSGPGLPPNASEVSIHRVMSPPSYHPSKIPRGVPPNASNVSIPQRALSPPSRYRPVNPGVAPTPSGTYVTARPRSPPRHRFSNPGIPPNVSDESIPLRALSPPTHRPFNPGVAPVASDMYVSAKSRSPPRRRSSRPGVPPNASDVLIQSPRAMSPPTRHASNPGVVPDESVEYIQSPRAMSPPTRRSSKPGVPPNESEGYIQSPRAMSPPTRRSSKPGVAPDESDSDEYVLSPRCPSPPRQRSSNPGVAPDVSDVYLQSPRGGSPTRHRSRVSPNASDISVPMSPTRDRHRGGVPSNTSDLIMALRSTNPSNHRPGNLTKTSESTRAGVTPSASYVSKPRSTTRGRASNPAVSPNPSYGSVKTRSRAHTIPKVSPNSSYVTIPHSIKSPTKGHSVAEISPSASYVPKPRGVKTDDIAQYLQRRRQTTTSDEESNYHKAPPSLLSSKQRHSRSNRQRGPPPKSVTSQISSKTPSLVKSYASSRVPSAAKSRLSSRRPSTVTRGDFDTPPQSTSSRKIKMPAHVMPEYNGSQHSSRQNTRQHAANIDHNLAHAIKSPIQSPRQSVKAQSVKSSYQTSTGPSIKPPPASPRQSVSGPSKDAPSRRDHTTRTPRGSVDQGPNRSSHHHTSKSPHKSAHQYVSKSPRGSIQHGSTQSAIMSPRGSVGHAQQPHHSAIMSSHGSLQQESNYSAIRSLRGSLQQESNYSAMKSLPESVQQSSYRGTIKSPRGSILQGSHLSTVKIPQQSHHGAIKSPRGSLHSALKSPHGSTVQQSHIRSPRGSTRHLPTPHGSRYNVRHHDVTPRGSTHHATLHGSKLNIHHRDVTPRGSTHHAATPRGSKQLNVHHDVTPRGSTHHATPRGSKQLNVHRDVTPRGSTHHATPHGSSHHVPHHRSSRDRGVNQHRSSRHPQPIPWTTINAASSNDDPPPKHLRDRRTTQRSPQFEQTSGTQALQYTTSATGPFHTPDEFYSQNELESPVQGKDSESMFLPRGYSHSSGSLSGFRPVKQRGEGWARGGYELISLSSSQVGGNSEHSAMEVLH